MADMNGARALSTTRLGVIGAACAFGLSGAVAAEPAASPWIVEVQSRSFEDAPQSRGGGFRGDERGGGFRGDQRGGGLGGGERGGDGGTGGDARGALIGSQTLDRIGDWTISLVRHENDVMCAMGARVGSDGEFWVKRSRSTEYYFMQIFDRGWRGIEEGQSVGLVFSYRAPDSTRSTDAVGMVTGGTFGLDIALEDADLLNLRRARGIEVQTDGGRFLGAYDLTGSARALDALDACVRANVSPGGSGRGEESFGGRERFEDFGGEERREGLGGGEGGKSSDEAGSGGFSEDELGRTQPFGQEEGEGGGGGPLAKSEPELRTAPEGGEGGPRLDDRAPPPERDPNLDEIIRRGGPGQGI